jgi:hypothetical protein
MDEKPTVMSGFEDEDLREIRTNMDQTKRDLASTMDDLRERYSPGRFRQEAREAADDFEEKATELLHKRRDDLRRVADRIGETIRTHPVPFAAAGAAGLGISAWALLRRQSGQEEGEYPVEYQTLEDQRAVAGYYSSESGVEFACETDEEAAGEGQGKTGRVARQIGNRAMKLGESARSGSERLRGNFVEMVREHPFLTGSATFLLGILSGLIFPSTKPEDEALRGARERVRQKAQEMTEEARESAQRVAEEARRAAAEEAERQAERHGLTQS